MEQTSLFLMGGFAAYESCLGGFIPLAGRGDAVIAILLQGGPKSEKNLAEYTRPMQALGVNAFEVYMPQDGILDLENIQLKLRRATGILIGGGHTPTYQALYAASPVREIIEDRFQAGIPVAGLSAGALIAPEYCLLPPDETDSGELEILDGLGLLKETLVSVHYNQEMGISLLMQAMERSGVEQAWGIEETATAVFVNGAFDGSLGQKVFRIDLKDLQDVGGAGSEGE